MSSDPTSFAEHLVEAMVHSDMGAIAQSIAPDVRAYITNAAGEADLVTGRQSFLDRWPAFASMAERFDAHITQAHRIGDYSVLVMVEIKAERLGRKLHNFAGILMELSDSDQLVEYRMVEALPEYSDAFWSATEPPAPQ